MQLCFDIETNGLEPDTIWCLVAQDYETGKIYKFSDHDELLPSIKDGVNFLATADELIGHNIINFDLYWIWKITGVNLYNIKIYDTLIMSRVLRYKRDHSHGLKGWGIKLGNYKGDYDDWSKYSHEMLKYCVQDVNVNIDIFNRLLNEYRSVYHVNPKIKEGLRVEHDAAIFNVITRDQGWKFDIDKAHRVMKDMEDSMKKAESVIEPKLGKHRVYKDKTPKTPKYTKNGHYTATSTRLISEYLGRTIQNTDTHVMPEGTEFRRYEDVQIRLSQTVLVKEWLLKNGWKPDDYTKQKIDGQWVNRGPKLTSSSLRKMGQIGELLDDYTTTRNRYSIVKGWIEQSKNGRLHGDMQTIGTPSMRCTHKVIVNLPANSVAWGKELRSLLKADDGWEVVGADSSGNQLRGLCHYVGDPNYTDVVVNGDQHQRNADTLGCSRSDAKTFLYAYLFGAGDAKLSASVNGGVMNANRGKEARAKFASSIQGLEEMNNKYQTFWRDQEYKCGDGWIPGLDGRPVFVPSEHQCLNYLLQSAEGITCKAAVSYAMKKIKAEGLRAKPRLFYHDEQAWTSHPEDTDRVGEILQESFKEAPKWFNVMCMDGGDYVKGSSYADVH